MAQQSIDTHDRRAPPFLERQGSRARASLPPLAIGRRSLQEWPRAALDDMDVSDWNAPATPGCRRSKTGPDVRLDLNSVSKTPLEPSDIQLKRNKFAFYDKECSRVANYHIYLGSDAVAKNRETLKAHGITHVLNCVGFVCPEYFKKDFFYKTLWLQDSPGEDITSLLYDVFDYFEEVGELGGRVFVHCCQGVSRSTSLVIAYMMWRECRSFEEAFQDVKASRGVTNPNMGFACQLLQCQKRVHAAPMSPTSVLRMYRIAPYSPYDPLHLVPKAVDNPGAGALDSRGAFAIHVPVAIFVWIGRDCDPRIAHAARVATAQVVRYERAQGPVHTIAEGKETDEFWESMRKYVGQDDNVSHIERVRNASAGNRIVPSYNADFELYERARQGGVVPPVPSTGAGMIGAPTRIPEREDGWSVLRRKFLSGELFPAREREMGISESSPSSSRAFSSPLFSPFSSAKTVSGCDSVSASPLSQLSILSPVTPSDSPQSAEVGSFCVSECYSLQNNSDQKAIPPARAPYGGLRKNVRMELGSLNSIAAGDKVTGIKSDGLSDVYMATQSNDTEMFDTSSEKSTNVLLQESNAWCMRPFLSKVAVSTNDSRALPERASSAGSLDGMLEAQDPVLYTWPQLERIDNFTADHLSSDQDVFVLVVPRAASNKDTAIVYVWVRRDVHDQAGTGDSSWQKIGQQFLTLLKCQTGAQIRVVKQGYEPEDLLAMFVR